MTQGPKDPLVSYSGPLGVLGSDKSRIPLKAVLGGLRTGVLSVSSHEQTQ